METILSEKHENFVLKSAVDIWKHDSIFIVNPPVKHIPFI